jgi:hypothetical protein
MDISEQLTPQKLQGILMNIYLKGIQSDQIKVNELIEEIKEQLISQSSSTVIKK